MTTPAAHGRVHRRATFTGVAKLTVLGCVNTKHFTDLGESSISERITLHKFTCFCARVTTSETGFEVAILNCGRVLSKCRNFFLACCLVQEAFVSPLRPKLCGGRRWLCVSI